MRSAFPPSFILPPSSFILTPSLTGGLPPLNEMKKVLLLTSIVLCLSSYATAQTATVEVPKFLPVTSSGRSCATFRGARSG